MTRRATIGRQWTPLPGSGLEAILGDVDAPHVYDVEIEYRPALPRAEDVPGADACRSCGAAIRFVRNASTGHVQILDVLAAKRVVLVVPGSPGVHTVWDPKDPAGMVGVAGKVVDVYTDHHVTCPDADAWRGRNREDPPLPGMAS